MALDDFKSWLQGQLTPVRQQEQSWVDLAGAIAESVYTHVDTYIDRLKARNSLYDMDVDDLLVDSEELRKIFPIDGVSDEDLPHVVMQRRDEIHFKKTVYPMISTLAREFSGMEVTWQPLWAPIDQENFPYGTLYATEDELNDYVDEGLTADDFFLTSRGIIRVPINKVEGNENGVDNDALEAFEAKIQRVIYPLIPLKIVCDGSVYFIEISFTEILDTFASYTDLVADVPFIETDEAEAVESYGDAVTVDATVNDGAKTEPVYGTPRFDALPIDAICLDRIYT